MCVIFEEKIVALHNLEISKGTFKLGDFGIILMHFGTIFDDI